MAKGPQSSPKANFRLPDCITFLLALTWKFLLISAQTPETLVETGSFIEGTAPAKESLRIATYNVGGPLTENIDSVYQVLAGKEQPQAVHVWALQEVRTSSDRNFTREMAQRLKMNYVHAVARPRGGGWEGLAFLSQLPLTRVERLELPYLDTGNRRRIALLATVTHGDDVIRLCNVHLPIRMNHDKRKEQMNLILEQLADDPERAQIVIGDFNTITGGLRKLYHLKLTNEGFETPFDGNSKTYQRYFFLRLKLDWIYLKGLRELDHGIEQRVKASDHRPVWVSVESLNR